MTVVLAVGRLRSVFPVFRKRCGTAHRHEAHGALYFRLWLCVRSEIHACTIGPTFLRSWASSGSGSHGWLTPTEQSPTTTSLLSPSPLTALRIATTIVIEGSDARSVPASAHRTCLQTRRRRAAGVPPARGQRHRYMRGQARIPTEWTGARPRFLPMHGLPSTAMAALRSLRSVCALHWCVRCLEGGIVGIWHGTAQHSWPAPLAEHNAQRCRLRTATRTLTRYAVHVCTYTSSAGVAGMLAARLPRERYTSHDVVAGMHTHNRD